MLDTHCTLLHGVVAAEDRPTHPKTRPAVMSSVARISTRPCNHQHVGIKWLVNHLLQRARDRHRDRLSPEPDCRVLPIWRVFQLAKINVITSIVISTTQICCYLYRLVLTVNWKGGMSTSTNAAICAMVYTSPRLPNCSWSWSSVSSSC